MSKVVDERVVEMRFDNRQFESNVQTSLSTLEKLKQKLNLPGAAKGLENINSAAKNVDMTVLGSAVETVKAKFSALEVMGVTALANITNSAVNAGKRMVKALTLDPIMTGFQEYETQINAVQTILANTQHNGTTLQDVNSALDTLNTYADKTIYNFTEMTRNIGTFTAAGVDLKTSVSAIQGIANLAAVSGSTSQQASTAMYQLSQALAAGRVSLMDWNSVVNAGMGGKVFQDALVQTAAALDGSAQSVEEWRKQNVDSYGSFRDSLTEGGWLTTDVLTKTLEQFTLANTEANKQKLISEGYTEEQAKAILEMAETATDAATKVKTFTQLWDTLKESVQSGWTQTWEILIGDFDEAKEFLTTISDTMGGFIQASAEARNSLLSGAMSSGWKQLLGEGIADEEGYKESIQAVAKDHGVALDKMIEKEGSFEKALVSGLKSGQITSDMLSESVTHLGDKIRGMSEEERAAAGYTEEHLEAIEALESGLKKGSISMDEFVEKMMRPSGRENLIEALMNSFEGLMSVIKPVSEAFREVFPPITAEQLYSFTEKLRDLTEKFKLSKENAENLKRTFKGIFSVFAIVADVIKAVVSGIGKLIGSFAGVEGGILSVTGAIGDWISGFRESVQEIDFFDKVIGGIVDILSGLISKLVSFTGAIVDAFSGVGTAISEIFNNLDFSKVFEIINGGLIAGILFAVKNFFGNLADVFDGKEGVLSNITGILDDVRGCFEAYQTQLKAGTLLKIASAIGILAISLLLISSIDGAALAKSLGAMTVLFGELLVALSVISGIKFNIVGVAKTATILITLSVSLVILAGALKIISSIDVAGIAKGLVAIGVLMAELVLFLNTAKSGGIARTATGLVILSAALLVLAQAVKSFGGMKLKELGVGLLGMAAALAAITIAMRFMPKGMFAAGAGMLIVAAALTVLSNVMSKFGGMSWEGIGKGLAAMGGSLAILAVGLHFMNGTLAGSAALIIAAGALAIMVPVLQTLGGMSWGQIAKGLITIAAAFAVVGVAGLLLAPLVPTILSLAGAFALFGLSVLAIGAGVTLLGVGLAAVATGFTALAAAGTAGATAIVAALTIIVSGIVDLIPLVATKLAEAIAAFCIVIAESAPALAESLLTLVSEVLASLAKHAPQIIDSLMQFIIGVLDGLSARMPELIESVVNLVMSLFDGVIAALGGMDFTTLIKGIAGVGFLAALMFALSAVASLVPGAMIGVLGMGLVIAELALVLAAIGALAQIPGLEWLISEGGQFLQTIGNAIGQFVGGLVGGIAEGITASLPQIGTDLSAFMTNLQPFIEGAKSIDPSVVENVKSLAAAILALTGANLIEQLTSWITGGSSFADFGTQLVAFGTAMKEYSVAVTGINAEAIVASAAAAKALTEVANAIPNTGGLASLFAGDNTMGEFGTQLVEFGTAMKAYSVAVTGINVAAITASVAAGQGLSALANSIPNSGGLFSIFGGDNEMDTFGSQLESFGNSIKSYGESVTGVNIAAITASVAAAQALTKVAKAVPKDGKGQNDLKEFGKTAVSFAKKLADYSDEIADVDTGSISTSVTAANKIVQLVNSTAGIDTSGVGKFQSAVDQLAQVNVSGFVSTFKNASSQLSGVGTNMISSLTNGLNAGKGSLSSAASSITSSLVKSFNSAAKSLTNSGNQMASNLAKGLKAKASAIKSAASSAAKQGATGAKGSYSTYKSAGKYLGDGLVAGINSKKKAAYNAGYALGAAAAQGVKDGEQSKSPSKLGIKAGKYLGEGVVIGIQRTIGAVYNTGVSMGEAAVDSVSNTISKIADVINMDIDSQPTIRPVVDLSDVESGASRISELMNVGSSVTALANVGRINSMMNRRNQNGSNDDVISAIDKLGDKLGNVGNTYNSIGGVSYNDGSDVAEAIQTIVRAATIERRV